MPGDNCSIYGCGTSRKHTGISILRIPAKDDNLSKKTREAWVRLVTRDREIEIERLEFKKTNRSANNLYL